MVKNVEGENKHILPILLDVMCDLSLFGYENCFPYSEGRYKSDAVVALALTHHLLLSQNLSIDYIFWIMAKYTRRYACIEFMPLGLWAEGSDLPPVPSWYTVDWFRENFKRYFRLHLEEKLEKNRILFCGELLAA